MVSVCLATFNGSKNIIRQVVSILTQLEEGDEIIISDDNSTDNTIDLLYSIGDNRIKVFINKGRLGPVGNFENAIKNSIGNYILLSDQDDVWFSEKVSTICNALMDHDLALSDCEVVDQDLQTIFPSFFNYKNSRSGFLYNFYKNSYIGCCMGFRREILTYILPFPKYINMHDWWIGLLVEMHGRVVYINQPLMKYVRHSNNASSTSGKSTQGFCMKLQNRVVILYNLVIRWFEISL